MRRDYFTLTVETHGDDDQPVAHIEFDGPSDVLTQRLTPDEDVDVAFRYQSRVEADDATGVFSVTDRMTGDFVLEANADATTVADLVDAAREYGQATSDAEGCYRVVLTRDGETAFETEKRTLLVYDNEGSLLRQHSLIPSGVEL